MSDPAMRKMKLIFAVIFLAASLAGLRATAQNAQIPVAPAGGIDPSKLPDIEGIHLGMSVPDAVARMKALFPGKGGSDLGVTVAYAHFLHTSDPAWQGAVAGNGDPCNKNNSTCRDEISITFNAPPNKAVAVSIERNLLFQQGKQPTPDTVKAALIQKYGPNPIILGPNALGWAFDEQGGPLNSPTMKTRVQCAGNVKAPIATGPSPTNATPEGGMFSTLLTQADINQVMRDQCRVGVYVFANLGANAQIVQTLSIKMSENSEDTRDVFAEEQYLDHVAEAQNQQQLKKAQQQAAPKF